jgi:hypothetical protein
VRVSDPRHRHTPEPDTGAAGALALLGDIPSTVRFELDPAQRFIDTAIREYETCLASRDPDGVPKHLPRASALLFGMLDDTEIVISDVEFVPNIRDRDEDVIAEFETVIAPRFGEAYRNPGRGFWCDESDVLQIVKRRAADGFDLLGSVHSHPNWQEIGPPHERRQQLSENPTQMDDYLFRQSGWPVNVIWYVHTDGGAIVHRVAGWRPGRQGCDRLDIRLPAAFCREFAVEAVV